MEEAVWILVAVALLIALIPRKLEIRLVTTDKKEDKEYNDIPSFVIGSQEHKSYLAEIARKEGKE